MNEQMILILGVTGSGKGRLAFELAKEMGAEIISVDSMKIYRRMNIGTAKPPKEAFQQVRYHLLDVIEPSQSFSVAKFLELANEAIEQIKERGKTVISVGGTALYIKALFCGLFEGPGSNEQIRSRLQQRAEADGLDQLHSELAKVDPAAAERINPNDARRIIRALEVFKLTNEPISSMQQQFDLEQPIHDWRIIGLRRDRAVENKRINLRVKKMISAGLVEEVESLLAEEKPLSKQARCAIGYAETIEYLNGKVTLEEAIEEIKKNTRRFAKNQRTWFKRFSDVRWLDIDNDEDSGTIFGRARELLKGR